MRLSFSIFAWALSLCICLFGSFPTEAADAIESWVNITVKMRKPTSNDVIADTLERLRIRGELSFSGNSVDFFGPENSAQKLRKALEKQFGVESVMMWQTNSKPAAKKEQNQNASIIVHAGVRAPQRIPWSPNLTLMQAIRIAGGSGWNQSSAFVIRDGKRLPFRLQPISKDPALDPKLLSSDQVELP